MDMINSSLAQLYHVMFLLVAFLLLSMKSSVVLGSEVAVGGAGVRSCIDRERNALLEFKKGVIDDHGDLSTWSTEEEDDCCKWQRVECSNQTGHVVKLDLGSLFNPLGGKISPSLSELHHLTKLDLSTNDFEPTTIPKFIGSLTKLKYLDLSFNNFVGTIPNELGNLTSLRYLDLGLTNTNVESLEWLSNLSLLKSLSMNTVDFSKANHWVNVINSLPSLSFLNLEQCRLSEVSFPFSSLISNSSSKSTVTTLILALNNLNSSMYPWFFNLTSDRLVGLDLYENQLEGPIPEGFREMATLEFLELTNNLLDGVSPNSLGSICSLTQLNLGGNNFSGNLQDLLHDLAGCAENTLQYLVFENNQLTGSFPDTILRFTSLQALLVSGNKLSGTLSESLGKLRHLEWLDISFNSFKGVVTDKLFSNLANLTTLDMSQNTLSLNFNSQWVPPFQLIILRLGSCFLGPHFPNWIGNQRSLYHLDVSNSGISDTIPSWFWDFSTTMTYLNLSSNEIRGAVSDLFNSSYQAIDLSSNHFEGPIPLLPSSLTSLDLSKNKFSGPLSVLCRITDKGLLTFLDLSQNDLIGELPDCLSQFPGLVVLNVAHNKLSGEIPKSIGSLYQLQTMYIFNNSFSGQLPPTLRNCTALSFLNVGVNSLSGNIPEWLGENLSQLYALSLGSNQFSGTIPSELCHLRGLQILDLSINKLHGTIPLCFHNFTFMVNNTLVGGTGLRYRSQYKPVVSTGTNDYESSYVDHAIIGWQGRELEFTGNLRLMKSIDLSSNNLTGEIPDEITSLYALLALNLSRNQLHGSIPQKIGKLSSLIALDLSRNGFSGGIPSSMASLNSLDYLDLSFNNLSGRIPSGTQLQSFDASQYMGNVGLCGPPLTESCPGDKARQVVPPAVGENGIDGEDRPDEFLKWFYIGGGTGFATGFWVICVALLFNRRGRHAFFPLVNSLNDWIYVRTALFTATLRRVVARS